MIGQTLAHYRVLEKIGSGGTGDVYLAEDTKLARQVALKVVPAELARDEERLLRFRREAKAIAALSHPNIWPVGPESWEPRSPPTIDSSISYGSSTRATSGGGRRGGVDDPA